MPAFTYWPLRDSPFLNMAPEQYDFGGEYAHYESIDQWDSICPYCFKTISSSRPPVFNPDNCGCVEAGTHANGGDEQSSNSLFEMQGVQYEPAVYYQRPQSTTSSSESVPCPEGPEHEAPNFTIGNTFLPLVAEPGLNEVQHRRSASFHSEMSYQMRRFLVEGDSRPPAQSTESASSNTNKFLSQEIQIRTHQVKKPKKRSKPSYQSLSSGDASFHSWGADPTIAIGTQFDSGRSHFENEYPLTISGMSGYHSGE